MAKDTKVYSPDGKVGHFALSHFSHWIERSGVYAQMMKMPLKSFPNAHIPSRHAESDPDPSFHDADRVPMTIIAAICIVRHSHAKL